MGDRMPKPGRFDFEITVTATASLDGADARQARDWLVAALRGADAIVATEPASDLVLRGLRPSDDATSMRVDGADPVAALAEAIRRHARRDDPS